MVRNGDVVWGRESSEVGGPMLVNCGVFNLRVTRNGVG